MVANGEKGTYAVKASLAILVHCDQNEALSLSQAGVTGYGTSVAAIFRFGAEISLPF